MKSQSALRFALISLILGSKPFSASATGDTNQAALAFPPPVVDFDVPAPRSDTFIRRFFEEVASSDSTVFDRFAGPAPKLDWTRKQDRHGYDLFDRWNSSGAR